MSWNLQMMMIIKFKKMQNILNHTPRCTKLLSLIKVIQQQKKVYIDQK